MAEDWSYGLIFGDQKIPITGDQAVLGRSRSCDIPISDPSVSRKHARLLAAAGELVVQDLGSSNGTLVNGQPTHDRAVLRHGDRLSLGDSTLVVQILPLGVAAAAQAGDATAFLQNRSIELAKQVEKASGDFDPVSLAPPPMPPEGTADTVDPLGTIRLSAVAAEDLQAAVEQETAITREPVIDPLRTMRMPAGGIAGETPEAPASPAASAAPAASADPRKTVHISADEILASVAKSRETERAAPRPGPRLDETRATVRPGSLPADSDGDELSLGNPALATMAMDVGALLEPAAPTETPSPSPAAPSPPPVVPAPAPATNLVPPSPAPAMAPPAAAMAERPPPASLLARVAAAVIDLGWAVVLGIGMAFVLGVVDQPRGWQLALLATLPLVALMVTIGWSVWGTSPGKRLLNLYVCTRDGRPGIGLLRAMIRAAGYLLTALTLGIGFALAAFGDRRALHDRLAGTYVARLS